MKLYVQQKGLSDGLQVLLIALAALVSSSSTGMFWWTSRSKLTPKVVTAIICIIKAPIGNGTPPPTKKIIKKRKLVLRCWQFT